jgi:hypothetical protein
VIGLDEGFLECGGQGERELLRLKTSGRVGC